MVFSSVTFLFLFLPVVLLLYAVLPRAARNTLLLVASLFFYAWGETFFVFIMLVSVAGNYLFGRWIDNVRGTKSARLLVTAAICLNLGLLFVYKYANFVVDNLNVLLEALRLSPIPLGPVHLPIGISFFTFQALSYVVDVYRGRVPAEKRFVNVALFISLFPQLIAGPIIRYRDVAAQILSRTVTATGFAYGVQRFVVGLAKKILIADTLGMQVDRIQAIPIGDVPTAVAWVGNLFFMHQLYFDFSGYSDMAIGLGWMFGFHFRENFNYPYMSKNCTEFWQRWHISLGTWFRDYLFVPLGSYRVSRYRAMVNLMIVFFLCGFWHGASWNFIFFGTFQGAVLLIERVVRIRRIKFLQGWLGCIYAGILFFIMGALFRCESMPKLGAFLAAIVGYAPAAKPEYSVWLYVNPETALLFIVGCVAGLPVLPWLRRRIDGWRGAMPEGSRAALGIEVTRQILCLVGVIVLFLLCGMTLAARTHSPFIYFRF